MKYKILAFREFSNPVEIGGALTGLKDMCVLGAEFKAIKARHVAIVRIKKGLFENGVAMLWGEAAEKLRQQAIDEGVFESGDPGHNRRDVKWEIATTGTGTYTTWVNLEGSTAGTSGWATWTTA